MTKTQSNNFQILLNEARIAGIKAVQDLVARNGVVPMIVGEAVDLFSSKMRTDRPQYFVADGPCGFAWIAIRPATSSFAKWLLAQGKTNRNGGEILFPDRLAYKGGVHIWVSGFSQSIQKKEAYAAAFAGVLNAAGITAYSDSRMD
jgi:hypothetical protein